MSETRPYKFLVIPVIQILDDEGNVIEEASPEQPIAVFGIAGLHAFADGFEADLQTRVIAEANGKEPDVHQRKHQSFTG
jgi:hypothetical protein